MYWMSLRVWIALLFRLWSAWLPFPAQDYGYSRTSSQGIDQRNPILIILSSPLKKIHPRLINKKEELRTVRYKLFFICVTFI